MEYGSSKAAIEAAERKINELTKQRDELAAALEGLLMLANTSCVGPWDVARQALAKIGEHK